MSVDIWKSKLPVTVALFAFVVPVSSSTAQNNSGGKQKATQSETIRRKLQVKEVSVGRIPNEILSSNISTKQDAMSYWRAVDRMGKEWSRRIAVSPDQKRVAVLVERDGKNAVVVDGKEETAFDDIPAKPWFSPDSRRLAYTARRGDLQCMVVDGVEGKSYGLWSGMYPIFSPDSENVAYMAQRGSNTIVVAGFSESRPYRNLRSETPPAIVFSPDSKRYAYSAELGAGQWAVVVDGKEGRVYSSASVPKFSADSRHVLYVARQGKDTFVVVDGIEGPPFVDIPYGEGQFSPDGKRVAYQARITNGLYVLMTDGQASKPYAHIESSTSYFSPDSRRITFAANKGGKACVVIDGKESPEYDGIAEMPLFSPDGRRVAHAPKRGWSTFVVLDGAEGKKYGDIYHLTFSPDSKHLAYATVWRLSAFVVQDGKEGPSHLLGRVDGSLMEIIFSPDSQRLAYHISTAGKAGQVVVDGVKSGHFEFIKHGNLRFSPDSKHVAYWAATFSGAWRVFVDGESTGNYDAPFGDSKLMFDGPDSLYALAQRGNEILRLEIKIPASQTPQ